MYICGTDSWENIHRLLPEQYAVACIARKGYPLPVVDDSATAREVFMVENDESEAISSTRVRAAMLKGDTAELEMMLAPPVVEYIMAHNLAMYCT